MPKHNARIMLFNQRFIRIKQRLKSRWPLRTQEINRLRGFAWIGRNGAFGEWFQLLGRKRATSER